jgi:MraZ protein
MFIGTFTHCFDDKGRLTLPAKFREELVSGVYITRGIDHCLFVYPRAAFESLATRMSQLPLAERNVVRHMFANAADDVPDRQGRVLIPLHLRDYAQIDGETVIIGLYDHLEIWQPDRWATVNAQQDPEALAERLRQYGI